MTTACDYLLRFQPIFRRYLWGGRRLGTMLGKAIGPGDDYAESWEIVDHGDDQSVVLNGALSGKTLGDLVREQPAKLLGDGVPATSFPLLFKFLDCNRTLSVQVHPNDEQGAELDPPDLGKTEAWVVLAAEPGSNIYAGLKPGVTAEQLAAAIASGHCESCLHAFAARVGDCVFIPAGTVHALGAGLVIAEIQQASDTTFRLHDWDRVDAAGKPRPLHVEESLATIDYARGPVASQHPQFIASSIERLVACDKFLLDRLKLADGGSATIGGDGSFHLLAVLEGGAAITTQTTSGPREEVLSAGQTALLPAAAGRAKIASQGNLTLLDVSLPR
ncbi:type I phosphomannose isomerase catalytic subunit [Lacipirellula limnantheis]|uniref:Putative mannose-6-phosphate isomerase GmuF n=1 Tax=Lacipirellula limnantheis TaxID=2528024 RepID=A0A517U160_9BACT|nr:type I phosphomannose isomerase catalytic subunit [Lacipirellula limnantheis]QDT74355.1 putative mannose-6-phosphate isomerase GmuF [Lacipirellula limnantheis]